MEAVAITAMVCSRGESPTHHIKQMNLFKDAATLIAVAAAPLVVVIAVTTLMALKVETQAEGDGISGIFLLQSNEMTSHTSLFRLPRP